jgi:uncharacterized protein
MILRDPVHGLIGFEAEEFRVVPELLETREVQRLRRVRQLGLTGFVYPGADHTRFSHAVGTAFVMTRFVRRLQELHGDLPYWQRLSSERARDAVAAALLHDLGHGPFSHLFEEALPGGVRHETWSRRIVLDEGSEVHQVLRRADPSLPGRVADLIVGRSDLGYLGHLLSGAFDVDRCDYLPRDAHFTGVSYGRVDLDWLLRSLRFGEATDPNKAPPLAIDGSKGLPAIESFILARLFMFEQVYFHKASRSSEWLLSRILGRAGDILRDGNRLEAVPKALHDLFLEGDTTLENYLTLDDAALWHAITAWRDAKDVALSDLCRRLHARKLFKTLRFYDTQADPFVHTEAMGIARELCAARGLDPNLYVGIDRAVLVPFDEASDGLKVIFPNGASHNPGDVSFVLGRLRGERLERVRLIFPKEIRDDLLAKVDAFGVPR